MVQGGQIYVFILFIKSTPPISVRLLHLLSSLSSDHWLILPLTSEAAVSAYTTILPEVTKRDYEYSIQTTMFLLNRPAAV